MCPHFGMRFAMRFTMRFFEASAFDLTQGLTQINSPTLLFGIPAFFTALLTSPAFVPQFICVAVLTILNELTNRREKVAHLCFEYRNRFSSNLLEPLSGYRLFISGFRFQTYSDICIFHDFWPRVYSPVLKVWNLLLLFFLDLWSASYFGHQVALISTCEFTCVY